MDPWRRRAGGLLACILAAGQGALGQCYLEDISATCSVCWTRIRQSTLMEACSEGSIEIQWLEAPPTSMVSDHTYRVRYRVSINTTILPLVHSGTNSQKWAISHQNIHSCVTNNGICTPFVKDSPGLSTQTPAQKSNMSQMGAMLSDTFEEHMVLSPGRYMIIAHSRFAISRSLEAGGMAGLATIDAAVGLFREVNPAPPSPSEDAYVFMFCVAVAQILTAFVITYQMYKKGIKRNNIRMDSLGQQMIRSMAFIILVLGEVTSCFISVTQEIAVDSTFEDIIPVSVFLLSIGVLVMIFRIGQEVSSLYRAYWAKRDHRWMLERLLRGLPGLDATQAADLQVLPGSEPGGPGSARELVLSLVEVQNQMRRQRGHIVGIVFFDMPSVVIEMYVLIYGSSSSAVVFALAITSALLGSSVSELSDFPRQYFELQKARGALAKMYDLEGQLDASWPTLPGRVETTESVGWQAGPGRVEMTESISWVAGPGRVEMTASASWAVGPARVDDSVEVFKGSVLSWDDQPDQPLPR